MKVEILKPQDLPSYKKLIDACFGGSSELSRYEAYQENEAYTIFVVKDGDEIAGSITQYSIDLFAFDFQPCLMLFNVAVSPDHRRKNIGRTLLEHVAENAKQNGYRSISLTCLGDADAAHRLYESVGFSRSGSVKYEMFL